ncbi:hypothetical protein Tco_0252445 [Tanacetum coccineum]
MQEFWATAKVHLHSIRFKMNNKKHIVNLEYFREMLQICPKLPNQSFEELPFEEETLTFLKDLGHSEEIKMITDVNVNKLHQPWRSFVAVINKCLRGKSTGYDNLRLSQAQILWAMYHKKNVDYAYLLWEDFVYQVETKNAKRGSYQLVLSLSAIVERVFDLGFQIFLLFMGYYSRGTVHAGGNDRDAEDALSKLLQMGTMAKYQNDFEMLINRVTGISESLLTSFYISGLKLTIQIELLRARPTTLEEAFSLARIIEARFKAVAEKEKEHINKKKAYTILSLQYKLASPEIKGSLDADEDIRVDEVSSAIDCVIHIGESNELRSKFDEFSDNKKYVVEVVVGGGEALGVDEDESNRVISVLKDGGGEFDDLE